LATARKDSIVPKLMAENVVKKGMWKKASKEGAPHCRRPPPVVAGWKGRQVDMFFFLWCGGAGLRRRERGNQGG
jgi:hypothetical protein